MTNDEKEELRGLLAGMVEDWEEHTPDLVVSEDVRLNEDSTTSKTTEAEILVFGLPRDLLYELHVARHVYEFFIGIVDKSAFSEYEEPLFELLTKAREICPPVRHFEQEWAFKLHNDEPQWFEWFAAEFFGLSNRHAYAFWHKHAFALDHLTTFPDESEHSVSPHDDAPF